MRQMIGRLMNNKFYRGSGQRRVRSHLWIITSAFVRRDWRISCNTSTTIASLLAKFRTAHLHRRSHKRHRFGRSCSEELQVPHSSYLTHKRCTTLDLGKATILHEAHKLSSGWMVFVLPPEKFSQTSSEISKRMCNYTNTGIPICRTTTKPPYEQKGKDCFTLEDGTDKLSRNFCNRLPINVT